MGWQLEVAKAGPQVYWALVDSGSIRFPEALGLWKTDRDSLPVPVDQGSMAWQGGPGGGSKKHFLICLAAAATISSASQVRRDLSLCMPGQRL